MMKGKFYLAYLSDLQLEKIYINIIYTKIVMNTIETKVKT
jgi:hypothetical protein